MTGAAPHLDTRGPVLLAVARSSIAERFGEPPGPTPAEPWLQEPAATFVTVTVSGALRGCIGSLEPRRSLLEDVRANACAAAFRDPRFGPLARTDLPCARLEVTLLSALVHLTCACEQDALAGLRPGIDGAVLRWRDRRGAFLPQVWDKLPDPEQFLDHLRLKAGLPLGFWDDELVLERFTAEKWQEPERPPSAD